MSSLLNIPTTILYLSRDSKSVCRVLSWHPHHSHSIHQMRTAMWGEGLHSFTSFSEIHSQIKSTFATVKGMTIYYPLAPFKFPGIMSHRLQRLKLQPPLPGPIPLVSFPILFHVSLVPFLNKLPSMLSLCLFPQEKNALNTFRALVSSKDN